MGTTASVCICPCTNSQDCTHGCLYTHCLCSINIDSPQLTTLNIKHYSKLNLLFSIELSYQETENYRQLLPTKIPHFQTHHHRYITQHPLGSHTLCGIIAIFSHPIVCAQSQFTNYYTVNW
jgi:hypothetical protein